MSLIVEPDSLPDLADREIAAGEEPLHMGHFYLQQIVLKALSRGRTDPPADIIRVIAEAVREAFQSHFRVMIFNLLQYCRCQKALAALGSFLIIKITSPHLHKQYLQIGFQKRVAVVIRIGIFHDQILEQPGQPVIAAAVKQDIILRMRTVQNIAV